MTGEPQHVTAHDLGRRGIGLPSPEISVEALNRTRSLFGRTLASWASDVLALRQQGLLTYAWRPLPGSSQTQPLHRAA